MEIYEVYLMIRLSDFCRVIEHLARSILSVKGVGRRIVGLKSVRKGRNLLVSERFNARD